MPPGEEVFEYHGYSGPCPKPPIKKPFKCAFANCTRSTDPVGRGAHMMFGIVDLEFHHDCFKSFMLIFAEQTGHKQSELVQPIPPPEKTS